MIVAQVSITIVKDCLNWLCTEQENRIKLKRLCARRSVYKEGCKTGLSDVNLLWESSEALSSLMPLLWSRNWKRKAKRKTR